MAKHRTDLTQGDIATHIKNLSLPMIFGILSIVAFNLADTYYVGKLGTLEMAALTYTFPVVLVLNSLNLGLGLGAGAVISRAVGQQDTIKVKRLTTDSLSLGLVFALLAMVLGLLTIDPLFRALGAPEDALEVIRDYMSIWYFGVPFIVIPMIGNNGIRALGDTKTPSMVMLVSSGMNIVLDPIFIFGLGAFQGLGVQGAALATVLARSITFCVSIYVLAYREKVVSFKSTSLKLVRQSWRSILYIGLPTALARMIVPIGIGVITSLVSSYGKPAVAAFGIASKIEYFALTLVSAVSAIMPAFIGQNFGAHKYNRIKTAIKLCGKFSLVSGFAVYGLLFLTAPLLAQAFSNENLVVDHVIVYLRIVPLAYPFQGILMIITGSLNALHMPIKAALLNIIQMLVIYIPLAFLLSHYLDLKGIYTGLLVSHILGASLGLFIIKRSLDHFKA